jgi:glycosyltransferase involved in cell wall biosynthesis
LLRHAHVIHAWDERTFTTAMLAGASRIIYSPPPEPGRHGVLQVNRAIGRLDVDVVCTTSASQRRFIVGGVPPGQCHLIRPPVAATTLGGDDARWTRAALRARLGIADDHYVLLAPGESTRTAGHVLAVWAASILHVVDEQYRIVLWGRGGRLGRAARLGEKLRQPGLVIVAERALNVRVAFADLLPAADALLTTPEQAIPTLPIAAAMAAGVPVVSVASRGLSDFLADGETAFTVAEPSARKLAQRVLDVRAEPTRVGHMTDRARELALQAFSPQRFIEQFQHVYRRMASRAFAHAPLVGT